jgi:hypothetical protein
MEPLNVALIGLDTSHTINYAHLMNDASKPPEQRVPGLRASGCLRFETPFQDRAGLDARQADLEGIGIRVTERLEEALAGCDAIMLTINDPAAHLRWFEQVARLGKPIFIDKPMAGSIKDATAIRDLARDAGTRAVANSNMRYARQFTAARQDKPKPQLAAIHGRIIAPKAGSRFFWYPVHTFEMVQAAMGPGAQRVHAVSTAQGFTAVIEYDGNRQAIAEVDSACAHMGGRLQDGQGSRFFEVNDGNSFLDHLREIERFFRGQPVEIGDLASGVEICALMDAAERSVARGGWIELTAAARAS